MRRLLLFFILFVVFFSSRSFAQMVGTQIYLPGHWLEIGQNNYGAFGATPPPAAYYPYPAGSYLAEVYDYGHDGWTVGAPAMMGDYTYPGSPFEGWGIQVGGVGGLNWAFTSSGGITGTGTLTGNNTSYVNAGGKLLGNWTGTAAGGQLAIKMETRVDTNASWVVVTAKLYNTGATTLNNIYYIRSCDPDNDEAHGGSFTTHNQVTFQIDADQRVGVQAYGETYTYAYLQMCTKDCRAKALVYSSWPIDFYVTDLSTVYTGTAAITPDYTIGLADDGDIATAIVYNLGNLCAHDSTFVSYAYTFLNTKWGIDSAFPEPSIMVNGVPVIPPAAPAAVYDTFNVCLYPGMTVLPVDLTSATSGVWTWSTWTWSPGTGLASTTGVTNSIAVNSLPPQITYTITGTPFSSCGGTPSTCGSRVIYLTVKTCNGATVNSPCLGDPLFFNAPGDSTGATYTWLGPNSWTSTVGTTQSFTITPSTWADTGTYKVIKTVAGTSDTSTAIVIIHPNPEVIATNNGPLCNDPIPANTLSLTATVTLTTATTYSWSGPGGFTSSIANPTISSFAASDSGIYSVIVTSIFGCKDTGTTHVLVFPPPGPPTVTGTLFYCYNVPFVPFSVTPEPGATVYWYPTAAGGVGTTTAPTVNTAVPGTYTFYYGESIGLCQSPIDSITVVVNPHINPGFGYDIHLGCAQDTVFFINDTAGSNATSFHWDFGDGGTSTAISPMHIYNQPGTVWTVTLIDYLNGCQNSITRHPQTEHNVTAAFAVGLDTVCFNPTTAFNFVNLSSATDTGVAGYVTHNLWSFGDGNTSTLANPTYTYSQPGIYNVSLIAIDSIGCQTPPVTEQVVVIGFTITSWHDTSLCLKQPLPLKNTYIMYPPLSNLTNDFTYSWTPATWLDNTSAHIPYFSGAPNGTYTYVETQSLAGSWGTCFATNTMTINVEKPAQLQNVSSSTTITYGGTVQLNSDSEVYYWWTPDNGTLNNPNINNPIAKPDTTTTYSVIGMDKYGCTDTAYVTIRVDSSMHECIPTGFTPNGDGLNDYFHPIGLMFQRLVDFRVYNRWGQQVYYSNNYNDKGWDGTWNGVPQDMGTYYYTIIVARPGATGEDIIYKGDVTLIR